MPNQCFALFSYGRATCQNHVIYEAFATVSIWIFRCSTGHPHCIATSGESGQGRRHGSKTEESRGGRCFIRADVERLRRLTSAPTEPRGVWYGEDMFPTPVGKGMGSWNFGLCTSNPVNFDAFWLVFLTVQPLAIYAKTGAGTDPGICVRGLVPPVPFVSLPISPLLPPLRLEVGPLKHSTGSGGAVSSPSGVRGRTPAENEFGAL